MFIPWICMFRVQRQEPSPPGPVLGCSLCAISRVSAPQCGEVLSALASPVPNHVGCSRGSHSGQELHMGSEGLPMVYSPREKASLSGKTAEGKQAPQSSASQALSLCEHEGTVSPQSVTEPAGEAPPLTVPLTTQGRSRYRDSGVGEQPDSLSGNIPSPQTLLTERDITQK